MSPDRLKFLHHLIQTSYVNVMHDIDTAEYYIDLDDGTSFEFSCTCTTDNQGRPGRYYAVSVDMKVLCEGFCLDGRTPTETTKNLMSLINHCSNKILSQEIHARQLGVLAELNKDKVHN